MKALIVQSRLAPFRIPFFDKLGEHINLSVFYGTRSANGNSYKLPSMLRAVEYREFSTILFFKKLELNWLMPLVFMTKRFDVMIIDGKTGFLSGHILLFLAKLRNTPVVLWTSGYESPRSFIIKSLKRFIEVLYYKLINRFLVYSSHGTEYLLKRGVTINKISIAHNSVNTFVINRLHQELFSSEYRKLYREKLSASQQSEVFILYVGRLTPTKNLEILLKAFSQIQVNSPFVRLFIVGDGNMRKRLTEIANELSLTRCHFLGDISDETEINSMFFSSDIFVMPGLGGLALQQAMSNGLPCIVSQADGTEKDLISAENGLTFENLNVDSLAGCLKELINDSQRRSMMGQASRNKIRDGRDMSSMIQSFIKCADDAIRERKGQL